MSEASIIRGLKDEKAAQLIRLYGNALREAERFMAYFAGETQGHFAGPGTPADCLAQIRQALLVDYDLNFRVGDKVYKKGGDYTFEGVVVSSFRKMNGAQRFVVEDDRGLLLIHGPSTIGHSE